MAAIDFPASPTDGMQFTAGNGVTYAWKAAPGIWIALTGPAQTAFTSDTPPANPVQNQLWFNSGLGQMFIWYVDANSSQWIPTNPIPVSPPAGVLTLYSESVLGAAAADIRVTIPANAKGIELEFALQNVGNVDANLGLQLMQGATPVATGYNGQLFYGGGTTPSTSQFLNSAAFININSAYAGGRIWPTLWPAPFDTVIGQLSIWGQNSANNTRYSFTEGFSGGAAASTVTGFRLVNSTAVNFAAGSFMRCFVVR